MPDVRIETMTAPLRVLLAEDAEPHAEAIRRAFAKAATQADIRVAVSLQAFREAVTSWIPDIALLDLNLPDGQAFDLLTWPPEDAAFPSVVMTSQGDEDTAVAAMKAGALDYIVKSPAAFTDMPHTVDRVLREWRLRVERRRAVEELRSRESYNRAVIETAADGFVTLDASGRVVDVNEAYVRRSGYTREELLGMRVGDLELSESAAETADHLESVARQGSDAFDTTHRAKDGTAWHAEVDVSYWPNDGGRYFSFFRDVTARKAAEEALRRSRQWMELHLQNTPLAVIEWDAELNVIEWNPSAEALFGYTRAEAIGRPLNFIVPESARPGVARTSAELIENRGGHRSTNENLTKAGKTIVCEWFNTTLVDRDGRTMGVASLVQDVTARRSLEAQLRESQKLEAVGQLAGGVAHDYNNILAATVMTLGLLDERSDLGADARQAVADLHELTDRAIRLTRQLLLFSRRSPLNVRTLNLNQVLADLHKMLHRLIGEHIQFEFAGDPGLPSVHADIGMIEQITTNLCVNARDAMPKGGRLSLRTSVVDVDPARARVHPDARIGRFVCLSVTDNGVGMSADVLSRIFEPFFTTKEKGKGTGLGLSTVFGIAKQHNGWVEVDSTPGVGSTFRVMLPADPAPRTEADAAHAVVAQGGHEVILLVEDEPSVRNIIAIVLKRHGYRVLLASDGREAQQVWEKSGWGVDVLYTDMIMPGGITGLELALLLKAKQPDLKVVISSGYADELAGPAASEYPEFLYLPKPVQTGDLLAAIRASLDGTPAR
jgi:two-component system cell cycle sensor histidine kinase/response regulator CckA